MAYGSRTTHQNVISCASGDSKPFRDFLSLLQSAARACIAEDKRVTLTSLVKFWTPQQKVQCVLLLTKFKLVTCVQCRVQTEWKIVTGLFNALTRTPTK
ncbi:hypothetical protein TNCV_2739921 [Trichonephila clavipes]|nr:hypothetical protein TNCV_2739921 [Trichonephila clavipes]